MRWKCTCAYDGTDYYGWQSQVEGNTLQDVIEARLKDIFKEPVRIHGSGRTDSGVHAHGQVFHFDFDWQHGAEKLQEALSSGLPESIQIIEVEAVTDDFHARFSATGKYYAYQLYLGYASPEDTRYCWSLGNRTLDFDAMQRAANKLLGEHDFTAFAALRGDESEKDENPVKDMRLLDVIVEGPYVRIETEASGYLYKMVRSLVGCLVDVGLGKLSPEDVAHILESKKRTQAIVTAPAKGLWLERVFY